MRLTADHPEAPNYLVYLNGRIAKEVVAADDEEGWVEMIDARAMANLDESPQSEVRSTEGDLIDPEEQVAVWEKIPTKKIYGEVEFKKVT